MTAHEREVRAFVGAFNDQELDRLVGLLDPAIEIHTPRGAVTGRERARDWARSNPDGALVQRLEIDRLEARGDRVLVEIRRQWHWRDPAEGGLADESELIVLTGFADGLMCFWQPYPSLEDARAALAEDRRPADAPGSA